MLLSLFFLLVIMASIWMPYGKNLADPRQHQKDDQFAKYSHTPLSLRFHLVFWCLSSNPHFGPITLKFLLNPITKETMTNLQNTIKRLGIIVFWKSFANDHQSDIQNFYYKIRAEPNCGPKYGQFPTHSHKPFSVKFLPNQITTHKMARFENIVKSLGITVLFYSYSAYNQNDTVELLP